MGLEPPPGCNFSSLKSSSLVKVDSFRRHASNLNSMLNSGWLAIRRVPVTRPPSHGSFSQQSLAYLQASAQYIKDVSKALRIGITTSSKSSSAFEEVQGIQMLYLRHCFNLLLIWHQLFYIRCFFASNLCLLVRICWANHLINYS